MVDFPFTCFYLLPLLLIRLIDGTHIETRLTKSTVLIKILFINGKCSSCHLFNEKFNKYSKSIRLINIYKKIYVKKR